MEIVAVEVMRQGRNRQKQANTTLTEIGSELSPLGWSAGVFFKTTWAPRSQPLKCWW